MKILARGFVAPILLILFVLLALGGGTYYYAQKSKAPSASVPATATTTAVQNETANWKMYNYTEYNLEFKYPASWRVVSSSNYFQIFSYPENNNYNPGRPVPSNEIKIETQVYGNITAASLDKWIDSFGIKNISRTEDITINGKSARKVWSMSDDETGPPTLVLRVFYLDGNQGLVSVSWPADTHYANEFDAVVRSFKFIK